MPDAILPICLAASGALVVVLCSLGGWLLRRRPKRVAPAPDADLPLSLERTLDQLERDDVVEIVAPHPRYTRAMSCAETEEHPNAFLPRLMEMRSLIHPGVVTSLVVQHDASTRRLRSAKGTPAPSRRELGDEPPTVEEPLLERLAPVPYRGRVRRDRPVD